MLVNSRKISQFQVLVKQATVKIFQSRTIIFIRGAWAIEQVTLWRFNRWERLAKGETNQIVSIRDVIRQVRVGPNDFFVNRILKVRVALSIL